MAIIRQKRKKRFSIIDNRVIEDKRLTWGARGLLEYMLSKPDDWKFYMSELITHSDNDGRDKTYGYLKELKKYGYVIRKQGRNSKGKFEAQDLIVTDTPALPPHTDSPDTVKPDTGRPDTVNPTLPNTDFKPNTDLNNTNKLLADAQHSFQEITTLWQNNWGFPNGIAQQDLTEWSKEFGNDLVYYCVEFALRHNVTARGADPYLNRKLSDYRKQGIKTVQAAIESDQRHEQQMSREYQQKSGSRKRQPINEGLPEWFKKQQEEQSNKQHYERIDDSGDPMPHD
ncbi:primosomal replication protein N [Limosilactobacillus reuteri]|uniref:Primosomal replication protein N n=1 Tax=Limosilactobacillus reuteri TaxID=1598 RepID=A0A855XL53_LIMRT|nr:DnaD domain protein [Limosilactobacillus reuteri]PWT35866.1 primosomal replication protein N [Limosilactobacillus reuteri]PWT39365.1 primosomal replication protein N [Limosilactobacillus reuteri]PWT55381.1 primosomal replication protein N [Limosilactobacillus reuteri]PWT61159.1 primosomal replication protein N [Limosilactobacillus reuteri]PWT65619.1 primosomal replication protein N [Limosilactobacillus reuteri]